MLVINSGVLIEYCAKCRFQVQFQTKQVKLSLSTVLVLLKKMYIEPSGFLKPCHKALIFAACPLTDKVNIFSALQTGVCLLWQSFYMP